jgi:hypothetical protein
MNLNPVDLRVDKLSEGRGLGHFPPSGTVNRRTLVFKREPNGWKIVHRAAVRRYSGRDFSDRHMAPQNFTCSVAITRQIAEKSAKNPTGNARVDLG